MTSALPTQIIRTKAEIIPLRDIIGVAESVDGGETKYNFDPEKYDRAQSLYRKPSYQRAAKPSNQWKRGLIESILKGRSIGSLVMSEWEKVRYTDGTHSNIERWYNVEDGGTRLGACLEFYKGEFITEYGDINTPGIKRKIDNYMVPIVMISKVNGNVRNAPYFKECCENFSLLQEAQKLNASDRYCAVAQDRPNEYPGSPIVNESIMITNSEAKFEQYCRISEVGPRGKKRNKTATAVSFISGAIFGPEYANEQYLKHAPILFKEVNANLKSKGTQVWNLFFHTLETSLVQEPQYQGERLGGYFNSAKLFWGPMMADVFAKFPSEIDNELWGNFSKNFTKRWERLITAYRREIKSGVVDGKYSKSVGDKWLDDTVYSSLKKGQKRNALGGDLIRRMEAVQKWYES